MKLSKKIFSTVAIILILAFAAFPAMGAEEAAPAKESCTLAGKLNINTADVKQLTMLLGIGEKTAENIIAFRTQQGNFKAVDDLIKVKGVGEKTMEKIRDYIILEGESTLAEQKK